MRAFKDESIDMILCAIGGEDTYRLLPYLFDNNKLENVVKQKIFLGFSDTTVNHFMLNKLGINTFYGQAFLPDICELSDEMLPYTKKYLEELLSTGKIAQIRSSDVWYEERIDFSEKAIGTKLIKHHNIGFERLRGKSVFKGKILGGCLESIYEMIDTSSDSEIVKLCNKYHIFPELADWHNKILLLETSEEKPKPELFKLMICTLKEFGIFDVVSGVLVGKPQNETYYQEYKTIILEEITTPNLPIVYNLNIGHAMPRCIIPFGVNAVVNTDEQVIHFDYSSM
ncbi:LD-carboxypeptidase [Enterococcus cecorum]|nr:LD-carboxypeptidase [Enterococcus cecorum]